MDISTRIRKFRIKLLVMLVLAIAPAIVLDTVHSNNLNIDNNPIFIAAILLYIFMCIVLMFVFLFTTCPSCNKGYFSEHGLPKLFYRLKCQSCGFNAFVSHNKSLNADSRR